MKYGAVALADLVELFVGRNVKAGDFEFQVFVEDDQANELDHDFGFGDRQDPPHRRDARDRSGHEPIIACP